LCVARLVLRNAGDVGVRVLRMQIDRDLSKIADRGRLGRALLAGSLEERGRARPISPPERCYRVRQFDSRGKSRLNPKVFSPRNGNPL
jgi:hypothetical protein